MQVTRPAQDTGALGTGYVPVTGPEAEPYPPTKGTANLDPNRAYAFLLLATIHIREGKRDVAEGEIARYLELEPNGKHAEEAKRLLKR